MLPQNYEYEVTYDVPLPDPCWWRGAPRVEHCVYPWSKMEPGGSFWVGDRNSRTVASAVARRNVRRKDQWYICRVFPTGVRVWRYR
jgi:hypothetical protein